MSDNGRLSIIFLLNLLLYFIAGELNIYASNWSIHFHVDALLIIFFGLYVTRSTSVIFVALLGLLADAIHPAPVGTYFAGYLILWLFFVWGQRRLPRHSQSHVRSFAAIAQALWILILSIPLGRGYLTDWLYWNRVLTDLLLSTVIVFITVWSWCQFQKRMLHSLGWNIEAQISNH